MTPEAQPEYLFRLVSPGMAMLFAVRDQPASGIQMPWSCANPVYVEGRSDQRGRDPLRRSPDTSGLVIVK